jgi:hypothetical protein
LLASDYRCPTPLWIGQGCVADATVLGLVPHLVASLVAWQRHFDTHFPMDGSGWDTQENRDWYAEEGARLHDRLRRALPHTDVELDLWPIDGE